MTIYSGILIISSARLRQPQTPTSFPCSLPPPVLLFFCIYLFHSYCFPPLFPFFGGAARFVCCVHVNCGSFHLLRLQRRVLFISSVSRRVKVTSARTQSHQFSAFTGKKKLDRCLTHISSSSSFSITLLCVHAVCVCHDPMCNYVSRETLSDLISHSPS